jgi:hypothetical protein
MQRVQIRRAAFGVAVILFLLVASGCGGGDESAADDEQAPITTDAGDTTTDATTEDTATETETETSPPTSGPAPAPGTGTLVLDDGRSFAITVSECEFQPSDGSPTAGSFEIAGTSERGSEFGLTQFFLNGEWSQTNAALEFPNRDQIYVITFAAGDGEPATVDGKTVTWAESFRELDESANRHVYTGAGTLTLTCP